jgi:hypothetical protein
MTKHRMLVASAGLALLSFFLWQVVLRHYFFDPPEAKQIHVGMTLAEAEQVMGRPPDSAGGYCSIGELYWYCRGGARIRVVYCCDGPVARVEVVRRKDGRNILLSLWEDTMRPLFP